MQLTCDIQLTSQGSEVTEKTLGKIAVIERKLDPWKRGDDDMAAGWYVKPYAFPIWERGIVFQSYEAAEWYALALAHEMVACGLPKKD